MIQFTVGTLPCMTTLGGALKHFGVSATLRRRIKHSGTCTCNGQVIGLQNFVHTGDTICISLPVRQAFAPEPLAFTRVYEDRHLLVINKPAGLLMHPTAGQRSGTLANAVSYYYITSNQHCAYHPVHRLDKNTSGLCMIAKNPYVQSLFDHAPNRYYKRLYLALSTDSDSTQSRRSCGKQHYQTLCLLGRSKSAYGFRSLSRRRYVQFITSIATHGTHASNSCPLQLFGISAAGG